MRVYLAAINGPGSLTIGVHVFYEALGDINAIGSKW